VGGEKNGKVMTDSAIEKKYFPLVKYKRDEEENIDPQYTPTMALQAYTEKSSRPCKVSLLELDEAKQTYIKRPGTLDDIQRNSQVVVRIAPLNYWVNMATGFGFKFVALEVGVIIRPAVLPELVMDLPVKEYDDSEEPPAKKIKVEPKVEPNETSMGDDTE
jgi:hypothetical protein